MKTAVFVLLFIFATFFCVNEASRSDSANMRMKRRPEDVEELIRDDIFMEYLLCEVCTLKENCSKPYCQYCAKCVSKEELAEPEINTNSGVDVVEGEVDTCSFCSSIKCHNPILCDSCAVCNQM